VYNIFHDEFTSDEAFFRQVDRDVALMKASAITHVMCSDEPVDPETRTLEWKRTDYLVKKFEDLQLKFVPLMLKEEQCGHYLPIWKFKEIAGLWDEYGCATETATTARMWILPTPGSILLWRHISGR